MSEKIIQILSRGSCILHNGIKSQDDIYGLSCEGNLYYWGTDYEKRRGWISCLIEHDHQKIVLSELKKRNT